MPQRTRAISDMLYDHIVYMESKQYSLPCTQECITTAKFWLRHFDLETRHKIRVTHTHRTPILEGKRVPNEEELEEVYCQAKTRVMTMISLIAKSGVRLQVLGNHNGTNGRACTS